MKMESEEEQQWVVAVIDVLILSCKSTDLLEIAYGLDGFYDVFSEDYYDALLH